MTKFKTFVLCFSYKRLPNMNVSKDEIVKIMPNVTSNKAHDEISICILIICGCGNYCAVLHTGL